MMHDKNTTVADVLRTWDSGDSIWSVEMGGLGPSYEQAIQVLVIELLRDYEGKLLPEGDDPQIKAARAKWGDDTVHRINESVGGFSGAQVGAARQLAWRILRDGYHATLESAKKHDDDRLIQVSNYWPHVQVPA